jgi:acyl carrier protein
MIKQPLTEAELISFCREELSQMMGVTPEAIDIHANFEDLRLNSIHAMQMLDELEDRLGITISPIVFWENPTLSSFCKNIFSQLKS